MYSFTTVVSSNTISAAFLCLPEGKHPPRLSGFEHILFADGMCYVTDGRVLLAQRLHEASLHGAWEHPPFGISREMAKTISSGFDNVFNSVEITVTACEGGSTKGGSVRIKASPSLILEEEMTEDFSRMATSIRGGLKRMKTPSVSSDTRSLVPRVGLATGYLALTCKIADHLNGKSENSVGVVLGGEKSPVLFSINEDASLIVMPVANHPYSSIFDAEESESESAEEKTND